MLARIPQPIESRSRSQRYGVSVNWRSLREATRRTKYPDALRPSALGQVRGGRRMEHAANAAQHKARSVRLDPANSSRDNVRKEAP